MANSSAFDTFYARLQKAALTAVWTRGITLARQQKILVEKETTAEIVLRVRIAGKPVSPKVTLWLKDEDWFCDCGDGNDPCVHVCGSAIALKQELAEKPSTGTDDKSGPTPRLIYRLQAREKILELHRILKTDTTEWPLPGRLTEVIGGIQSGRRKEPLFAAAQEDYQIDSLLIGTPFYLWTADHWARLFKILKETPTVEFDGETVSVSRLVLESHVEVKKDAAGFRLFLSDPLGVNRKFENQVALKEKDGEKTFQPLAPAKVSPQERLRLTSPTGIFYSASEETRLFTQILPELEKRIPVRRPSDSPELLQEPPRIEIEFDTESEFSFSVVAHLGYGSPFSAYIVNGDLLRIGDAPFPARDLAEELKQVRRLQTELHLKPGQRVRFEGRDAIEFQQRLKAWKVMGKGQSQFDLEGTLLAQLDFDEEGILNLSFATAGGKKVSNANTPELFRAWSRGESYFPLAGGGFARLPQDWMTKYGAKAREWLRLKDSLKKEPTLLKIRSAQVAQTFHGTVPDRLALLKTQLEERKQLPEWKPPRDFVGDLRDYQKIGVQWLNLLKRMGLSGLLADDMGLGKTLQTLAVVEAKSLVITPTSVLTNWKDQAKKFRPGLKVEVLHVGDRDWEGAFKRADLVITSYGILRQDIKQVEKLEWNTIILDESQTIKNRESLIASAIRRLQGQFKIALSGTPLENRMSDLLSQFEFLLPGILPDPDDDLKAEDWKSRFAPFILRRKKSEVARELPARTETTLYCELSEEERTIYDTILASAQKELQALADSETEFKPLAVLEAILRLRQACCHPSLLPGRKALSSSKLDLFLDALDQSLSEDHRVLVFSQWTSFLNIIQEALDRKGIEYFRIDGSTQNRGAIVEKFQAKTGAEVLLMSLKAGGVGLTLTAADHVYILDPWWNPAAEAQAADRAHRIGQERPVLIQRLAAKNTIEERILALQEAKKELAESVLEGRDLALSRDELVSLIKSF